MAGKLHAQPFMRSTLVLLFPVEGYRLIFDRELAVEVRNTHLDSAEESGGILETMRIKIFIMVSRPLGHCKNLSIASTL